MNHNRPGQGSPRGRHSVPEVHRPAPKAQPDEKTRIQQAVGSAPSPEKIAPAAPAPQKPGKKGRIRPGTVIARVILNMFKALLLVLCIGLVAGSVVAVQLVQYVVEATENDEDLLDLESRALAQTTFFMAPNPDNPNAKEENDYIEYQQLVGDENRVWVNYDQIPEYLVLAVIATEDRTFEEHHGVNFRRTVAAFANEIFPVEGMTGGASTVTQQLVKNLTDDDVVQDAEIGRAAGWQRKLREIFRAWGLENQYTKQMIMESYLNTMGLSGRIAGVEAGAQAYFGKSVSELNLAECATIAGITQYPSYYSPFQNPDNCLARRNRVIGYMLECEYITQAQADEVWAMDTLGLANSSAQQTTSSTDTGVFSYAVDKTFDDVLTDLQKIKGLSYNDARKVLYNNGLRIYMTVDLNVQDALDNIMTTGYKDGSEDGEWGYFLDPSRFPGYKSSLARTDDDGNQVLPQVAVAVIDNDGQLIATSGGIGEKEGSLSLNRSIGTLQRDIEGNLILDADGNPIMQGTLRQVGSTMKPIAAYALGIDYGIITYSKTVADAPVMTRDPNKRDDPNASKDWPTNYNNRWRQTKITVAAAITESTNTVAAQVGMWVGRENMYDFLRDYLQVSSLDPEKDIDLGPLVLGSQTYGMSAYELAGAYQIFGGDETYGTFNSLHSYVRVEDSQGNIYMEPELSVLQAIDPQSGYVMNRLLDNVMNTSNVGGAAPTAGGMKPAGEMDAVGKTGTTNDDFDRWFVGITPYYITAVWWGYDQGYSDAKYTLRNWSPGARTNIPVNVWKTLMEEVQADLPYKDFPPEPEGIFHAKGCTISGDLAGPGCPTIDAVYTDFETPQTCTGHTEMPEGEPVPEEG